MPRVRFVARRGWLTALALTLLTVSCAEQPSNHRAAPSETQPQRVTQIPLSGSGYVYDVAIAQGAAWVTSHAGLYRIDPATDEAVNVLPQDYLFRVVAGHGALWISTGADQRVIRLDPRSKVVTAEIVLDAGPVTDLAVSEDAVWASASSDLLRIDPATNEVVARLRYRGSFGDVAFGEGGLWVIAGAGQDGAVWRIDPATNEVLRKTPLPNPSFWNEIAAGDGAVWVTTSPIVHQDGAALVRLHRIDPSTGVITAEIPLGEGAYGLGAGGAVSYSALAVGEGSVWGLVFFESILLRIDPGDLSVIDSLEGIAVGSSDVSPGLAVGAGAVWVTAPGGVSRVSLQS
jgi:ligand-binding sensor domain-containing protein